MVLPLLPRRQPLQPPHTPVSGYFLGLYGCGKNWAQNFFDIDIFGFVLGGIHVDFSDIFSKLEGVHADLDSRGDEVHDDHKAEGEPLLLQCIQIYQC